ncbi:MAG TPA: hypothetical protein VHH36_06755 [Candidatus Thermoplasmatota archaeon]|nr:hypothetical protein [Candidatus Thermoplasmatota archaeon]
MRAEASARLASVLLAWVSVAGCVAQDAPAPDAEEAAALPAPPLAPPAPTVQETLDALASRRAEPLALVGDVTVNVVLVGIDPALVDVEALRAALPPDYSPRIDFGPVHGEGMRSGILHRFRYEVRAAPDAFAEALFAQYPAFSREADIPGGEDGFLSQYDEMYGLGRAASGKVRLVDATKVEDWIEANREAHGLRFERPEATIFFLDSWTKHKLWADGYYWYSFDGELRPSHMSQNMRTWGGTHGFLLMDYSAAPNDEIMDNSGIVDAEALESLAVPVTAPEGTAYNDPPTWHYRGDTATIGQGALEKQVTLTSRVAHAVDAAVNVRIFGDYSFRPIFAERYHINLLLWHDGRSIIPTDSLGTLLDLEALRKGLNDELPWADVTVSYQAFVAPRDDPGMDRAIQRAKAEGAGSTLALAPIFNHVDANAARYKQGGPGAFDVVALLFMLEGHYGVFLPAASGGVGMYSPDGIGWGAITGVNDFLYVTQDRDMAYVAAHLMGVNAHEVGHFFGLSHAHNGYRRTPDGYVAYLDHTWSGTNTIMSYRVSPPTSDAFGRDILARAHALESLEATLRDLHSAYRALQAAGVEAAPPEVRSPTEAATAAFDASLSAYARGDYRGAVDAAIAARRAGREAMDAAGVRERDVVVERWTAEGVHHAGAKNAVLVWRPSVSPTGPYVDYRPIALTDDVERVTVRATWTNAPDSWGDFFVGWRTPIPPYVDAGPVNSAFSFADGVHDEVDEGPQDGAVTRSFSLDLNVFRSLRDAGVVEAGAGTQGMAVNGAYAVEVVLTYRDHGDGGAPGGAA